jgi:hypothetical protein
MVAVKNVTTPLILENLLLLFFFSKNNFLGSTDELYFKVGKVELYKVFS